jgi:heme-degrading monooxygenase HmoA
MHVILWEFQVHPTRAADFCAVYGVDGAWTALFRRASGFIATEFLRDPARAGRYVTIDRWHSRQAFDAFKVAHAAEYQALDARCEALTESEICVGEFDSA